MPVKIVWAHEEGCVPARRRKIGNAEFRFCAGAQDWCVPAQVQELVSRISTKSVCPHRIVLCPHTQGVCPHRIAMRLHRCRSRPSLKIQGVRTHRNLCAHTIHSCYSSLCVDTHKLCAPTRTLLCARTQYMPVVRPHSDARLIFFYNLYYFGEAYK